MSRRTRCSGTANSQSSGVRMYPSGAKVCVVQTRRDGRSTRVTVGRHGVISASRARRRAALMLARRKAGENPFPPRPAPLVKAGDTVADVADRFLEYVAVRSKPWTMMTYPQGDDALGPAAMLLQG